MAQIIKTLNVDVARKNRFQALMAKQYDSKSRYLKVRLQNESVDIAVEEGCTVIMNALRADGQSKGYAGSVNEDGTVMVPITSWMLALDDTVVCDISVVDSSLRKLTSMSFEIEVDPSSYSGDDIAQDENYDLLVALMSDVTAMSANIQESANTAYQALQTAEAKSNEASIEAERAEAAAVKAEQSLSGLQEDIAGKGDGIEFDSESSTLYLTSDGKRVGSGTQIPITQINGESGEITLEGHDELSAEDVQEIWNSVFD